MNILPSDRASRRTRIDSGGRERWCLARRRDPFLWRIRSERLAAEGRPVHRSCEQEHLAELAAHLDQSVKLARGLDTFRHDPEVERRAERHDRLGEGPVRAAPICRADEFPGDLEDV